MLMPRAPLGLTGLLRADLKQVLRRLKLGKMLDTLPERLTLAKQQHLSHAAFLELVLPDEATRRVAGFKELEGGRPGSCRRSSRSRGSG